LTIAVSTILSAFNSLTLSPALCALLLKPRTGSRAASSSAPVDSDHEGNGHAHEDHNHQTNGSSDSHEGHASEDHGVPEPPKEVLPWWAHGLIGGYLAYAFLVGPVLGLHAHGWEFYLGMMTLGGSGLIVAGALLGALLSPILNIVLQWAFRLFNFGFNRATNVYTRSVGMLLRVSVIVLVVYGGLLVLTWYSFTTTPTGFIPQQDKGFLLVNVRLPDGASVARTREIMQRIEDVARFDLELVERVPPAPPPPPPPLAPTPPKGKEETWTELQREMWDIESGIWKKALVAWEKAFLTWKQERDAQLDQWCEKWRQQMTADHVFWEDGIYRHVAKRSGVNHTVAVSGQSLLLNANAPNFGSMYVMLDHFDDRLRPELTADALADQLRKDFERFVPGAEIGVYGAPPVEGLGTAGGFKIVIEDRGNVGGQALQDAAESAVERGNQSDDLEGLFTSNKANTPWLYLEIDRLQAAAKHVTFAEVAGSLQVYYGGFYVNDFNKFGRTWQVNVQADKSFRGKVEDLKQLKGRSQPDPTRPGDTGSMVPLAGLGKAKGVNGPVMVVRYNMYPAAIINGNGKPGVSSGDAILRTEETVKKDLPRSMRYEWTELARLQQETDNTAMLVFLLAVVLVFLVLAAQYESWSLPLAVILVVPMCLLCSIAGVVYYNDVLHFVSDLARQSGILNIPRAWGGEAWQPPSDVNSDINIFTQIGFVVLVGLACKNAILIVEFAKAQRERGVPTRAATLAACRLRLRPILMTSFAFILGVVPLVIAEGAGAEMRRTLGTAVFFGMLGVTLCGIFLTPVFYYVIQWLTDLRMKYRTPENLPQPTGHSPSSSTGSGVYTSVGH
jgi:multidrug efflux pump subunit AcrB